MPALPCVTVNDPEGLAKAMRELGVCRVDGLPAPMATVALRHELQRLQDDSALTPAAIGHGDSHIRRADLRGDSTLWLDDPRCGIAAAQFLATLDALRVALDRQLFIGLTQVEAHYAAYPAGAGYIRHRDRFHDDSTRTASLRMASSHMPSPHTPSTRTVSLVSYLNDDWLDTDGGQLRLHLSDGAVDVRPLGGSSVCFLSELEHEVLPAVRERLSIAAWFRSNR